MSHNQNILEHLNSIEGIQTKDWNLAILQRCIYQPHYTFMDAWTWENHVVDMLKRDGDSLSIASNWLCKIGTFTGDTGFTLFIQLIWLQLLGEHEKANNVLENAQVGQFKRGLTNLTREAPLEADEEEEPEPFQDLEYQEVTVSTTARLDLLKVKLTAKNSPAWFGEASNHKHLLLQTWVNDLERLFFQSNTEDYREVEKNAVMALRQMRVVAKKKQYVHDSLQSAIKKTGLAKLILEVSRPGQSFATHLKDSFQKYHWRESLLDCLLKMSKGFVPKDLDHTLEARKTNVGSGTGLNSGHLRLLYTLSSNQLIPLHSNPHSIFFLTSENNFISAYYDWISPSLKRIGENWFHPTLIKVAYQSLCRLRMEDLDHEILSEEVLAIFQLSLDLRKKRKAWKRDEHKNRNRNRDPESEVCRLCAHMEPSERCEQTIYVIKGNLEASLEGKVIFPDRDKFSLNPDVSTAVSLPYLKLRQIRFKESVFQRCGRLIVYLVDEKSNEMVSGVSYNILTLEEMKMLDENQRKVKKMAKVSRGKTFSPWSYGEMHAIGSRQPSGGRCGDGYGPYPGTRARCVEEIQALFAYTADIECILAKIDPYVPSVVKDLKDMGEYTNSLGSYGVTAYHCWNYMAPQHRDVDATWTVAYQLYKIGCSPEEFSFSFSTWGHYLETVENCVWWFRGNHLHGTIVPRPRTLQSGCLSQGVAITLPLRSFKKAKEYAQARWSWEDLVVHWKLEESR